MIINTTSPRHTRFLWTAGKTWLGIAFTGLLFFSIYILIVYIWSLATGNFSTWANNSIIGFTPEDLTGNIVFGLHVVGALIISLGGPLQLMPAVRKKYPKFHKINGRLYIIMALVLSLGGLYLIWVREASVEIFGDLMVSTNGVIILICAYFTISYARARKIEKHNRWALRLFLAMSGVYFFRIILMFWIIINGGPVGFNPDTFTGPAISVINVIVYVLPIGIFELFMFTLKSKHKASAWMMSAFMIALCLAWIGGIAATSFGMWWPAISA